MLLSFIYEATEGVLKGALLCAMGARVWNTLQTLALRWHGNEQSYLYSSREELQSNNSYVHVVYE